MHEFKHPKHYAELRAERRKLQAASSERLKAAPATIAMRLKAAMYLKWFRMHNTRD